LYSLQIGQMGPWTKKGNSEMKRLALLLAICSTAAFAASWDGTKGDITLATLDRTVPLAGTFTQEQTTFIIRCSNLGVNAVRVSITYHNGMTGFSGNQQIMVHLSPAGSSKAIFTIPESTITSVSVTELFDGSVTQF
jgi:hypothetical protein